MAFLKTFGEADRPKSRIILGSVGPARDRQGIRTYKSDFKFYYDVAHLFYPALWAKGPQVVAGKKVGWAFGPPPRSGRRENIHELLTTRAHIYEDDGNSYQKARGRAYRFSTNSVASPPCGGRLRRPHKYKCTNAPTVVWCIEAAHINICAAVGRRPTQYLYKLYEITFRLKFKSHVISMYYIILYIRSK